MIYPEFKEWLEINSTGYEVFLIKATEYQIEKNMARPSKKRWSDKKINRAVNEMWKQVVTNAFEQVKNARKTANAGMKTWQQFLNEIEFVESFNDGMAEMSFD
ncbi:TPA: hypothetical protein ACOBTX_000022 [Enterococcus faecium]